MERQHIEKNRLDLAYHRQLQILNGVIILGTTGLISFIGTFVWKPELILQGMLLTAFIAFISLMVYFNVDNRLRSISEELGQLK